MQVRISPKILDLFRDFIMLLFTESADEESILLLNPLNQIKMAFKGKNKSKNYKYLNFDFL